MSAEQLLFLQVVAMLELGVLTDDVPTRAELDAVLARPLATFAGELLYSTPFARAAALMAALIEDHPFAGSNARTATMAAAFWLEREGYRLNASAADLYSTASAAVSGALDLDSLERWLREQSIPLQG